MTLDLWLDNLLAYSVQIAALGATGTVLPFILKLATRVSCCATGKRCWLLVFCCRPSSPGGLCRLKLWR